MTRDPRVDPQPGDELQAEHQRAIVEGATLDQKLGWIVHLLVFERDPRNPGAERFEDVDVPLEDFRRRAATAKIKRIAPEAPFAYPPAS